MRRVGKYISDHFIYHDGNLEYNITSCNLNCIMVVRIEDFRKKELTLQYVKNNIIMISTATPYPKVK